MSRLVFCLAPSFFCSVAQGGLYANYISARCSAGCHNAYLYVVDITCSAIINEYHIPGKCSRSLCMVTISLLATLVFMLWTCYSLVPPAMHLVLWCVSPSPGGVDKQTSSSLCSVDKQRQSPLCHLRITPDHGAISLYIKHLWIVFVFIAITFLTLIEMALFWLKRYLSGLELEHWAAPGRFMLCAQLAPRGFVTVIMWWLSPNWSTLSLSWPRCYWYRSPWSVPTLTPLLNQSVSGGLQWEKLC